LQVCGFTEKHSRLAAGGDERIKGAGIDKLHWLLFIKLHITSFFTTASRRVKLELIGGFQNTPYCVQISTNASRSKTCSLQCATLPGEAVLLSGTAQVVHGRPLDICGNLDVIWIRNQIGEACSEDRADSVCPEESVLIPLITGYTT